MTSFFHKISLTLCFILLLHSRAVWRSLPHCCSLSFILTYCHVSQSDWPPAAPRETDTNRVSVLLIRSQQADLDSSAALLCKSVQCVEALQPVMVHCYHKTCVQCATFFHHVREDLEISQGNLPEPNAQVAANLFLRPSAAHSQRHYCTLCIWRFLIVLNVACRSFTGYWRQVYCIVDVRWLGKRPCLHGK